LLERPAQAQRNPAALTYPAGWSAVLAGLRTHTAGRLLVAAELASIKRALRDPGIRAWGAKLRQEHLIDEDDWETFCSHVERLPEPLAASGAQTSPSTGTLARRASGGVANAIINAAPLARLREKRTQRSAAQHVAIADRARDAHDWSTAATFYQRALQVDPRQPAIWVQLGHALKGQGNLAGAEEAYHKSLLHDDSTADTYLQLGHVLKLQRRPAEAENAYFEALRRDADLDFARQELTALGYTADMIEDALSVGFLSKELRESRLKRAAQ
jgi:tetratricopeptide (TPR) repeat protein